MRMNRLQGLLVLVCLSAAVAYADSLSVTGSTTGTFSLGNTSSAGDLSFQGGPFAGSTVNPVLNLGTFTLAYAAFANLDPYVFDLHLSFSAPIGTSSTTIQGDVLGLVALGLGGATIDFSNSPIHFTYSNASGSGSFDLTLNDVYLGITPLHPSDTETLTGSLSHASYVTTPEPASVLAILFMSTLLGGVVFLLQKRLAR